MSTSLASSSTRTILPAVITRHHLRFLIDILERHEQRWNAVLILPVCGSIGEAPFVIDLRLCTIALAEIAACFDHDPAVIRIVDEAQFDGLRVTVSQAHQTADIVMTLSSQPDTITQFGTKLSA